MLELQGDETVLEVGTGSGYQAAVLAQLAQTVHTIERHAALAEKAEQVLQELGVRNVAVHLGDGTLGLPRYAPYQAIMVTAASPAVPPPLLEQLADGGRLVIPVGGHGSQMLERWRRQGTAIRPGADPAGGVRPAVRGARLEGISPKNDREAALQHRLSVVIGADPYAKITNWRRNLSIAWYMAATFSVLRKPCPSPGYRWYSCGTPRRLSESTTSSDCARGTTLSISPWKMISGSRILSTKKMGERLR